MREDFRMELVQLINKHSMESGSDTPDFILASFLLGCLKAFDEAVNERYKWYLVPTAPLKLTKKTTDGG